MVRNIIEVYNVESRSCREYSAVDIMLLQQVNWVIKSFPSVLPSLVKNHGRVASEEFRLVKVARDGVLTGK